MTPAGKERDRERPPPGGLAGAPRETPESVGERLRARLGRDVDPRVTLEDARATPAAANREAPSSRAGKSSRGSVARGPGSIGVEPRPPSSRYDLRGEVARGGMGTILKVWDRDLRRNLAMKVLREKGGASDHDSIRVSRFLEEAQITGQLDHPGIVPVHELGVDPTDRVFFTMRLVKGRDLRRIFELARRGEERWTKTRALGVLLKVCEAMAYAHEKRVIHRDLKPANVMVGRFGETYVMDWGLARVLGEEDRHDLRPRGETGGAADGIDGEPARDDENPSLSQIHTDRHDAAESDPGSGLVTMDGDVIGTPAYMAPEQARGELRRIGPHSDIYAAGAMLYHLVADHPPYFPPGERLTARGVLQRVLDGPPASLAKIAPEASAEIVAICEKAMAREAAARYASMLEMAEDVRAYLEGRVVRAYETGAVAEFRKCVSRNRGMAAAVAGLAVLLLGGALAFAWQQRSLAGRILVQRNLAAEARDAALTNEREARQRSYLASLAAADASLRANDAPEAMRRLEACEPVLRGWEWRHLRLRADASLAVLDHGSPVDAVAFLPDGSRLLTGSRDGIVRVWDAATGRLVQSLEAHEDQVTALAVHPRGHRFATASRDGAVRVWEADTGDRLEDLLDPDGAVTALAWDPRGDRLVWAAAGGSIRAFDVASRETHRLHEGEGRAVSSLTFTPRGDVLATGTAEGVVRLLDAATGRETARIEGHDAAITAVAIDGRGTRLVSGSIDNMLRTWSLPGGEPLLVMRGHGDPVTAAAFGPRGETLVSASMDKTVRVWDATTGEPRAVLRGHGGAVRAAAIDARGLRAASGSEDGTVRLWDPLAGEAGLVLSGPDEVVSSVAVSANGARVAAGGRWRGSIRIWDAASGLVLLDVPGRGEAIGCVVFDPAGTRLAAGSEDTASLVVLDARTGATILGPLTGHEASITGVAFTPDGASIVTSSTDGTGRIWDAATGAPRRILEGHDGPVTAVAVGPGGASVATASADRTVRVWDAASGKERVVLEGHGDAVRAVAFDPTGALLASGSLDQTARIWDATSGKVLHVLEGHARPVTALAFSPDGARLVTGSLDRTVRVWDAARGELLLALRGHERPITAVAFAGDGGRIVSASFDNTVRVWEAAAAMERFLSRRAAVVVEERVASLVSAPDVIASLRDDPSLEPALRDEALRIAGERGDDPVALFRESWGIARRPGGAMEDYLHALRLAEIAVRLAPQQVSHHEALGTARFRLGAYRDALVALERARELREAAGGEAAGEDTRDVCTGILAMTYRALGRHEEARRVREMLEREVAGGEAGEREGVDGDGAEGKGGEGIEGGRARPAAAILEEVRRAWGEDAARDARGTRDARGGRDTGAAGSEGGGQGAGGATSG